jgi:hypothetical protein
MFVVRRSATTDFGLLFFFVSFFANFLPHLRRLPHFIVDKPYQTERKSKSLGDERESERLFVCFF